MVHLKFKDETMSGKVLNTWTVPLVYERATVLDIIKVRVRKEVEKYNESVSDYFNGLIQPSDTELTLNGYKMKKKRKIDIEEQCLRAVEGFQTNQFILLYNNKQAESLEEVIEINENMEITFIKLTPLVGG